MKILNLIQNFKRLIKKEIQKKFCRYNEHYLSRGRNPECPLPLRLVVVKTPHTTMVLTKLNRHFTSNLTNMKNKIIDYFKNLLKSQNKQSTAFVNMFTVS